jgi:3-methyladenine DNA glycosylase/8-oxoguanine DNA glycosylase
MLFEDLVRPRGPYSLRLTTSSDAPVVALPGGESGAALQTADGLVRLRATSEEALVALRFVLALEDDHTGFARRFSHDRLLGPSLRRLHGMRPLRLPTVTQSVLRAFCGQLIDTKSARRLERAIGRACGEPGPTREALAAFAPAELVRLGLAARRAAALVRICRSVDLEGLRALPIDAVAARLLRERMFGPWSLGVVALEGLGSYRYGLVGDLALVKLYAALHGRWVEPAETAVLLEPYEEWAGLASIYLMSGYARGLVPGAGRDAWRAPRRAA